MTENDVKKIFNCKDDIIVLSENCNVTIDNFLNIAGFKNCEPTKEAMLEFDAEVKGYKELIKKGNFE